MSLPVKAGKNSLSRYALILVLTSSLVVQQAQSFRLLAEFIISDH